MIGLLMMAAATSGLIAQAKHAVRENLKDPMSAVFKEVYVTKDGVCGEVNAKNGYGGYSGFSRFVFAKKAGVALINPDDPSSEESLLFDRIESKVCY